MIYDKTTVCDRKTKTETKTTKMSSVYQRRPCEYVNITGSEKNFTLVLTPHFLDRRDQRARNGQDDVLDGLDFDKLFNVAKTGQCYAYPVCNLYMYVRRAWHRRWKRWEFELISLTPANHLQTKNRHFALPFPGVE